MKLSNCDKTTINLAISYYNLNLIKKLKKTIVDLGGTIPKYDVLWNEEANKWEEVK